MSNIKIETLSQIHIGNGVFLQKGNDYLADGKSLYVLNMDKLGSVIGTDEKNIQQWLNAIDKGNAETFIKTRIKDIPYEKFSKRCIESNVDLGQGQSTLKECIHDGLGRPYIPGSSIKGAIRTAVLSTLTKKEIAKKLEKEKDQRKWKRIIFGMESDLLHFISYDKRGKRDMSPSTDIFRFVCTGDAYFDRGVELAVNQENLNIREQEALLDRKRQQVVETIRKGVSALFRLKILDDFFQKTDICDLQDLFELINNHTYQLICDEISFWDKGEGSKYTGQDLYLDQLETILDRIDDCKPGECVLRMGQASGWRFITGAWLENIDKDYFKREIVPICRPHNNIYQDYPFPKSRRIDSFSNIFGFVKLTIL
ncbi:MAG: type III-A CRISPR-associated RAMP protein Csm5 [Prevotella sp.]|nr:type III-A CRISPR-associated RAMP protein Csm5 [Prevotella sp.]